MGSTSVPETAENKAHRRTRRTVEQPLLHPLQEFSKDPQVKKMKAFCNKCLEEVSGSDALGHMFFGTLKCAKCPYLINRCSDFRVLYPAKGQCKVPGSHHTMTCWEQPVLTYLSYCSRRNLHISQFCQSGGGSACNDEINNNVLSYIKSLKPLKNIQPWKNAFKDEELIMNFDVEMVLQHPRKITDEAEKSRINLSSTDIGSKKIKSGIKTENEGCTKNISGSKIDSEALKVAQTKFHKQVSIGNSTAITETTEDTKNQSILFSSPVAQTTQDLKPQVMTQKLKPRVTTQKLKPRVTTQKLKLRATTLKLKLRARTLKLKRQVTAQMRHDKIRKAGQQNAGQNSMQSMMQTTNRTGPSKRNSNNVPTNKRKHSKREQLDDCYYNFIRKNLSKSDNFLVIEYPEQDCPEACPNCYSRFDPIMCTLNLSTFITDLICHECHLSVYIVVKGLSVGSAERGHLEKAVGQL